MELKQIKELMSVMQRTGTKRLVLKRDGVELELEREERQQRIMEPSVDLLDDNPLKQEMAAHRANLMLSRGAELAPPSLNNNKSADAEKKAGTFIVSPMVGTYYASPSADDPPFVKVGDKIEKDTIVCIIEAMKVMNEVKAGVSGTVAEVLVQNAHPVEFGTQLIRVV